MTKEFETVIVDRRKGIERIIERIQRQNPRWAMVRVLAEAKAEWHRKHNGDVSELRHGVQS